MIKKKIAVIGAGNMGAAIAEGIISSAICNASDIVLTRRNTDALAHFADKGCTVTSDNAEAVRRSDAIILGVKPQMTAALFEEIRSVCHDKLVISIAAGVTVDTVEKALPGCAVVRVMPNTPLMVGEGVSVLCRGSHVSDDEFDFVKCIFDKTGVAPVCDESLINPVTALTSSSVAYFARFIDDMCRWAVENGFEHTDRNDIIEMVCKTASGTADLILEKGMEPAALVRAVTSPNGTTERALRIFDEKNFDGIISEAMSACRDRADELSRL